jgi:hypothetical protein
MFSVVGRFLRKPKRSLGSWPENSALPSRSTRRWRSLLSERFGPGPPLRLSAGLLPGTQRNTFSSRPLCHPGAGGHSWLPRRREHYERSRVIRLTAQKGRCELRSSLGAPAQHCVARIEAPSDCSCRRSFRSPKFFVAPTSGTARNRPIHPQIHAQKSKKGSGYARYSTTILPSAMTR